MSGNLHIEDLTHRKDEDGKAPEGEKHELVDYGVKEVDGLTFSFVEMKHGGTTRTGHEISFTEGGKEYHVIPVHDPKRGVVTFVEIIEGKRVENDVVDAKVTLYSLENRKLRKHVHGRYRGKQTHYPTFGDTIRAVIDGKHRAMKFEKVE